jgi:hypothetical protein
MPLFGVRTFLVNISIARVKHAVFRILKSDEKLECKSDGLPSWDWLFAGYLNLTVTRTARENISQPPRYNHLFGAHHTSPSTPSLIL